MRKRRKTTYDRRYGAAAHDGSRACARIFTACWSVSGRVPEDVWRRRCLDQAGGRAGPPHRRVHRHRAGAGLSASLDDEFAKTSKMIRRPCAASILPHGGILDSSAVTPAKGRDRGDDLLAGFAVGRSRSAIHRLRVRAGARHLARKRRGSSHAPAGSSSTICSRKIPYDPLTFDTASGRRDLRKQTKGAW